jgi:hypothetical protein
MANLYDKAGLVNIPVGYQDGFLYNIKPEDNTLAFRFNRDSAATLVNSKGLIEQVGYFGPELVQNGNFSEIGSELITNGDFSSGSTGWSSYGIVDISNGIATIGASSNSGIFQGILTQNKSYKVTFNVLSYDGVGNAQVVNDAGTQLFGITQPGSYTFYFKHVVPQTNIIFRGTSNALLSIDNVSVKQVDPNDYWTLGTGWSFGDNKAVFSGVDFASLQPSSSLLTIGKTYKISLTATITNGSFKVQHPSSSDLIEESESGSYSTIFVATSNTFSIARASVGVQNDFTITNISVVEILGDKPRIDYTDSLTSPSFLLEPQSTNLVTFSEDFSQWTNTGSETIDTANALISPSGLLNATKLQEANSNFGYHRLTKSITASSSTDYSLSFFAKKGTISYVQLLLININNSESSSKVFDLENGVIGETILNNGSLSDSKIEDFGNGWYRCSIVAQLSTPPNTFRINLANAATGNTTNLGMVQYAGSGSGNIYIWGAQLEQSSYPTSYIPTASSTVTRAQETCIGAGNVSTFNSTEGVLYAEMASLADDGTTRYVSVSDGGNQNAIAIRFSDVNNQILAYTRIGGVFNAVLFTSSYSTVNFNKIAYRYKSGDSALFINGTKISSSTSTQTLPANTLNTLNFNDGLYAPMEGKVKGVYVFNEALTDDELQQLTGPE